jgi:L-threonylcarbamoyladenylate synthase
VDVLHLNEAGLHAARRRMAEALRAGELVVAPTDTVYGVYADVTQPDAIGRLVAARRGERAVPPAVVLHNPRSVPAFVEDLSETGERLMAAYWPGPLSLVLTPRVGIGWQLGEDAWAVTLRMPAEPLALQVLYDVGPLACTTAARAGAPPPTTAGEAQSALSDHVALYIDDGPRDGTPSTVVDLTRGTPEVLREGAVPAADIEAVAARL